MDQHDQHTDELLNQQLLANHLAFLSSHRGTLQPANETLLLKSDRPEFTYALLGRGSNLADLPAHFQTLQHFPWSTPQLPDLESAGFSPTMGITYMVFDSAPARQQERADLEITEVKTSEQMDLFSQVQARGFTDSESSFADWHPWLKSANDRNLHQQRQRFYVASLKGAPIATALVVLDGKTAGIYAVATLAAYRKQGISTTLMERVIAELKAMGLKIITLQCKQDSYVEEFYRRLGFKRVFTTGLYRRNT